MEVKMNKKFRIMLAMLLMFTMVLSACTPNMKAYMAESEKMKTWGPTKGSYTIDMNMSVKDESTGKTVEFKMPGTMEIEMQDQEHAKFDYSLDFTELKKTIAAEDPEEAATLPDSIDMVGFVQGTKVIFDKGIFVQLDDADDFPAVAEIEEKYIAIDMGNTFVPVGTTGPDTIKYLQSAEFTSDLLKLSDTIFAGYEPVTDYVIDGDTFTYEADIDQITAETVGVLKAIKNNWTPFMEEVKPIAYKMVADSERATVDEALLAFEEVIKEVKDEEIEAGLAELKEMLKGSKIKTVEEFKEDEITQDISYTLNFADVMNMDFVMKGSMKKVESVDIEYPTDVKSLSFEEYMALFMDIPDSGIVVLLNDEPVEFDTQPIIEEGRTLVPFRALLEKLGATVEWDEGKQLVTATKDETVIKFTIGEKTALVGDKEIELDVPAKILDSRTLIPLRFVSENLGYKVEYLRQGNFDIVMVYTTEYLAEMDK